MALQVEAYLGEIRMWGGTFAPVGWRYCDGTILAVSQYQALFSLIGNYYGGDGRTTFALPDLRGRAPVNFGHGPGLTNYSFVGLKNGSETTTLTAANLPPVEVAIPAYDDRANVNVPSPQLCMGKSCSATAPTQTVEIYSDEMPNTTVGVGSVPGNDAPVGILQPLLSVCFIIAVDGGIFPQRS